jgi:alanine-glyoxylate transaminase/serine-glyoxylate transaminase/serine-pyruvate transaminase
VSLSLLASSQGVVVAGGLLPGMKYFRIGHMHLSATQPKREHVATLLAALWGTLAELGYEVARPVSDGFTSS